MATLATQKLYFLSLPSSSRRVLCFRFVISGPDARKQLKRPSSPTGLIVSSDPTCTCCHRILGETSESADGPLSSCHRRAPSTCFSFVSISDLLLESKPQRVEINPSTSKPSQTSSSALSKASQLRWLPIAELIRRARPPSPPPCPSIPQTTSNSFHLQS